MKINYGFIIFIGIFLTLYGLLHFYFYRKVTKAFNLSQTQNIVFIIILILLLISPIVMRLLDDSVPGALSSAVSYTGYLWMGIIFMLFVLNLAVDLYSVTVYIASRIIDSSLLKLIPDRKVALIAVVVLVGIINIYGSFEAWNIKTERIALVTDKFPAGVERLRVVQISDIHFSSINGVNLANRITGIVSDLEPDLLVSTGDLIDDGIREPDKIQVLFSSIKARYGKYGTTGNHEFYTGIVKSTRFTESCGIKLLRNECVDVNGFVKIAAIDDPAGHREGVEPKIDESSVVACLSPDKINIFLKHQPRIEKKSLGKFDVQLSGHTHDGQIFPFNLIVGMIYKYMHGLYYPGDDSFLYVSRGTGTWGPPIRFLSPPEITIIDFIKEKPLKYKIRKRING